MSLRGLPDWHRPLAAGGAFAAYEQPGVWFAEPVALDPGDGDVVDRFAQDRGDDGGIVRYGLHTLHWETRYALEAAGEVTVRPLPFDGGVVRLTGPAMLRDPRTGAPALGASFPLDQAGLTTFVASVVLDDTSTELVIDAHRRGMPLIGADATLVAPGVAARYRGIVEINLATLSAVLLGHSTDGAIAVARLRELLAAAPEALGVEFSAGLPADDVAIREAAEALLDRVVTRFASPLAPLPREAEALELGARIPARVALRFEATAGLLRWDLSEALVAPRLFGLSSPGITPRTDPVVRDHAPPTLASGWHRICVSTTAAPPWAGGVLGFEIEIPPAPPFRPQTVRAGQVLTGADQATVDVRLTPLEPLGGTVTGTVVFDSGQQLSGTAAPLDQEAILLRTDAFPAAFLPLELSATLEDCSVTVDWVPDAAAADRSDMVGARLGVGGENPRVTLLTPTEPGASLLIRAVDPAGRVANTPPMPVRPLLVDAFLFPGVGPQTVQVEVDFGGSTQASLELELVPEGDEDDPGAVVHRSVQRQRPRAEWTRFVADPFATGYRWRITGAQAWSAVREGTPGTPLRVPAPGGAPTTTTEEHMASDDEVRVAGLTLTPLGEGNTREWAFLPDAPSIATQPGGDRAMSLLEVGDGALLTIAGRLTATDDQQAAARAAVGTKVGVDPSEIMLTPAPLSNVQASVQLDAGGATEVLGASETSGAWPFDAVFHVQLTGPQAEAVRRSWGGQRGVLTLRYTATSHSAGWGAPRQWGVGVTSSSVSTTTTTTTHSSDGQVRTETTASDHAEGTAHTTDAPADTPVALELTLDGADWPGVQHR